MSATGHRQVDHTADLALELWAPSEEALLAEGARALVAIVTEHAAVDGTSQRTIELDCLDREDRLVCWLNEVLALALTDEFLCGQARLTLAGERGLRAEVSGEEEAAARLKTELKMVTYHDLVVEQRADGSWFARLVVDV